MHQETIFQPTTELRYLAVNNNKVLYQKWVKFLGNIWVQEWRQIKTCLTEEELNKE